MRFILSIFFIFSILHSNESAIKENHKDNSEKIVINISEKEKKYQEYKKKKELENQKLEEDGFCSCNND